MASSDRTGRSAPRSLGLHVLEHLGGRQHRLAYDGHAHVAGQMEQHLGELGLGPAFPEGEAQMDVELGMAAGRGVRNDANKRARLEIEARARPQRAEHGLCRHIDELRHDRIALVFGLPALEGSLAHQFSADRFPFLVKLAVSSHRVVSLPVAFVVGPGCYSAARMQPNAAAGIGERATITPPLARSGAVARLACSPLAFEASACGSSLSRVARCMKCWELRK